MFRFAPYSANRPRFLTAGALRGLWPCCNRRCSRTLGDPIMQALSIHILPKLMAESRASGSEEQKFRPPRPRPTMCECAFAVASRKLSKYFESVERRWSANGLTLNTLNFFATSAGNSVKSMPRTRGFRRRFVGLSMYSRNCQEVTAIRSRGRSGKREVGS